ncbi:MAG: thiamine pyrophosphate-dependent dehydrogenase E1 component subunit alpha [bacterium]
MEKVLLENFYRKMVEIRFCEESFVEPILSGEIKCPVHLCTGQEATAVGVCSALEKSDYVFGNHRSHGHYLAMGGAVKSLVAEVYTKLSGCSKGRGGSMHITAKEQGFVGSVPIVAGTISLAMGAALAIKIRKESKVAVSFFGDGATGEGTLYESLNFAALKKLPIIFVCENNLYSTHLSVKDCRPDQPIFKIARPFGIATSQVDGNDVIAVFQEAKKAVELCRQGAGPFFLECLTYRMRGHVGPGDNIQGTQTDIRPESEIKEWKKKDPIKRLEILLIKDNILTEKELEDIKQRIKEKVADAHKIADEDVRPCLEDINKYVFK